MKESFGHKIRDIRINKCNMTLRVAAQAIGITSPYLSRIDIEKVRQRTTQCQPSFQQLSTIFKSQRSEVARLLQSIPISNWLRYGLLEGEGHVTFRELIRRYFEFDRDFFQMLKEYVQQNEWISFD